MHQPHRLLTFVLPFLCATAAAQVAPDAPSADGRCGGELAAMRAALERIAAALEGQAESRAIDIAFRRLELSIQEHAPLQNEMRAVQNGIASIEAELVESGRRLTRFREQAESGAPPDGLTLRELELSASTMEDHIAGQRRRLALLRSAPRRRIESTDRHKTVAPVSTRRVACGPGQSYETPAFDASSMKGGSDAMLKTRWS